MQLFLNIIFVLILTSFSVHAENFKESGISLDGSTGSVGQLTLKGPHYDIKPEYGQQKGNNLFHSFHHFNLLKNETATFTGSDKIQNIISRVTGGNPSWINGKIESSISGADFYLLNPNGIMFGPDSSLNIGGSFYASTCDYIKFDNNDKFYMNLKQNSVLKSSAPSAFGFLAENIQSISIEGKGEIQADNLNNITKGLEVKNGKSISFVCGEIEIKNGTFFKTNEIAYDYEGHPYEKRVLKKHGSLNAPQGIINLISLASKGEIIINNSLLDTSLMQKFDNISILDKSLLNVDGDGAGSIYIRGDNFLISDSSIYANNSGIGDGGTVDIRANNIYFVNGSRISINNYGTGVGTSIKMIASKNVNFSEENYSFESSGIDSISAIADDNAGNSGSVFIQGENITFSDGAAIIGNTHGGGNGSDIFLHASDTVTFRGSNSSGDASKVCLETHSKSENAGKGGDFEIEADNVIFNDGAVINCLIFGHGDAGTIKINGKKNVSFLGNNTDPYQTFMINTMFGQYLEKCPGGLISFATPFSNGGNGSSITIIGGEISLLDSSLILSCTFSTGNSGKITINAKNRLTIDGSLKAGSWWNACISTGTTPFGPIVGGNSGDIFINAGELIMTNGAAIDCETIGYYGIKSGRSGNININVDGLMKISGVNPYGFESEEKNDDAYSGIYARSVGYNNTGDAGYVNIKTGSLIIENGAKISASTETNNTGGNIEIQARDFITIKGDSSNEKFIPGQGVKIITKSGIYSNSISQDKGSGAGGKISINTELLSLEDKAIISTSSQGGDKAGDINIDVNKLILNNNTSISSASKNELHGGFAGKINVEANDSISLLNNSKLTTEAVNSAQNNNFNDSLSGKILLNSNKLYLLNSEISTSVKGGSGNGGDININDSKIVLLNNSKIIANAYEGSGGNIYIGAKQYVKSTNSTVSASSTFGLDGNIDIKSPDINVSNSLSILPSGFINEIKWNNLPCSARTGKNISRFVVIGRDGLPQSFNDWHPSPFPLSVIRSSIEDPNIIEGENFYQNGKFVSSLESFEKALSKMAVEKNSIDIVVRKSDCFKISGHYKKALSQLLIAIKHSKNSNYKQKIMLFNKLADYYLCSGNIFEAYDYLGKIKKELLHKNDTYLNAAYFNNKGIVNAIDSNYIDAVSDLEECLLIIDKNKKNKQKEFQLLKSKALINLVQIYCLISDYKQNVKALNKAMLHINSTPDSYNKNIDILSLGILSLKLQQIFPTARKYFAKISYDLLNKSDQLSKEYGNSRILSYTRGYLGQLYFNNNQIINAIKYTKQAIFHAQSGNHPESLFLWQWKLGEIFKSNNEIEKAIKIYKKSIYNLNNIRQEMFIGYRGIKKDLFKNQIKPLYLGLISLIFDKAETVKNKEEYNNLLELARQTTDNMKFAEIQNYFKDECITEVNKNKNNKWNRNQGEAVLYPILLPDRLELLLILPNDLKRISVSVDSQLVNETVIALRKILEYTDNDFIDDAADLYDWLIRPIEKILYTNNIKTLVISPDGSLCLLPFSVLYDGSKYLIQKYAIAIIPSLSLIDFNKQKNKKRQLLLNGLSKSRHNFDALPGVKKELIEIKSTIGGNILLDEDFTKYRLSQEFNYNDFSIIHFATHGYFGKTSKDTYLLTYDDKLTMDDLEELVGRIVYRGSKIDLITLSACQTAVGDERAAFGIAGITLKAGAKSSVASIWVVDDQATCLAFTEFYRLIINKNNSKAAALQNVQKMFLNHKKYNHPAYWAPFILIGNWI